MDVHPLKYAPLSPPYINRQWYIGAPGHTAGFAHGTQAFFLHVMSGGVLLVLLTHM